MNTKFTEESICIEAPVAESTTYYLKEELCVKRFYTNRNSPPVLMIHGSIENGKIFYSSSGKGLAPYLAKKGYDVFVVDLRGRGLSKPSINKYSKHGLSEILKYDFPLYINKIKELKGDVPQHWVSHSWGGVLILAYLARNYGTVKIASMVFFATKRKVIIKSLKQLWNINILWNIFARLSVKQRGFFAAKQLKAGSDNETKRSFDETADWVKNERWIDWYDKFDYAAALKKIKLPPTLYVAGIADDVICNLRDMKLLMHETGEQNHQYRILGKSSGNKNDYGHIDILTHSDCEGDVYPMALEFIQKHS